MPPLFPVIPSATYLETIPFKPPLVNLNTKLCSIFKLYYHKKYLPAICYDMLNTKSLSPNNWKKLMDCGKHSIWINIAFCQDICTNIEKNRVISE